jgi:hypothetical protein
VRSKARGFGASLVAAVAAWLTFAPVVLTGQGAHRIAVLSARPWPIAAGLAIGLGVWLAARRGASLAPLFLLVFVLLPWTPLPLPPALLLWSGRTALFVWAGVAAGFIAQTRPSGSIPHPVVAAGAIAFIVYSVAAWQASPSRPAGDEPEYLVITQSLLYDRDLRIENNHRRGEYHAYFAGERRPSFLRRGLDGEIYSIHAPGIPALVLPAFAIGGYPAVVVFLVLVSAFGSALAWHVARRVTGNVGAAWFAWAAVGFNVTAAFQSFSIYPDGVGGVLVLTGVWALVRARTSVESARHEGVGWFLHGAALAILPWLHSRFAILAATLDILIAVRLIARGGAGRRLAAFLAAPFVSLAAWLGFFVAIYGTPNPAAPYFGNPGNHAAYIADGLVGLLFDQRFGVLAHAPVLALAVAGIVLMLARPGPMRSIAVDLLAVIAPYLAAVTSYRMWWGGWSVPGRFFMPVLPMLVLPIAVAYDAIRRRGTRATAFAALGATLLLATILVTVDGGELAYNVRTSPAHLIEWLASNVDLAHALPLWSSRPAPLFGSAAIWADVLLATWLVIRAADQSRVLSGRGPLVAATVAAYACAAMLSVSLHWIRSGRSAEDPAAAQVELLRTIAHVQHIMPVSVDGMHWLEVDRIPAMLRIHLGIQRDEELRGWSALATLPFVPAGVYDVRPDIREPRGEVLVAVSNTDLAVAHTALFGAVQQMIVRLPVDVRSLVVRGDEEAASSLRGVIVQPMQILCRQRRVDAGVARRAVTYPDSTVFFLDDAAVPDPTSFWIGCGHFSRIVIQPSGVGDGVTLLIRNGPIGSDLTLQSPAFTRVVALGPSDERTVGVPVDPRAAAVVLQLTSSGNCGETAPAQGRDRRAGVHVTVE